MQWQVFDVAKNVLKSWQEEAHYQLHKYNLCRILVRIFLALFLSFFFPEYFWSWTWLDEREIPSILEHKICEFRLCLSTRGTGAPSLQALFRNEILTKNSVQFPTISAWSMQPVFTRNRFRNSFSSWKSRQVNGQGFFRTKFQTGKLNRVLRGDTGVL